jgi:hypothetical protein
VNYFALEPILLQRLKDQCPSIGDIQSAPDLFALSELCNGAKATTNPHRPVSNIQGAKHGGAYVVFFEEVVTKTSNCCDKADQIWLIAVCAKKSQDLRTGAPARQENGYLVDQVLQALRGWNFGKELAAQANKDLPEGAKRMGEGRFFLERITSPVNRMQMVGMGNNDGLTITLLAYKAKNLIF